MTIVFDYCWKVCFVVFSVEYLYYPFGGISSTDRFLSLACIGAMVTLGLSCKLTIFLIGRRILSIVMVFSLKSSTAPISCKVCFSIMRSYIGAVAPASYSTMSGVRWTDLLSEYSTKERGFEGAI